MAMRPDLAVPADDNTADDYAAETAIERRRAGDAALAARAKAYADATPDQNEAPGGAEPPAAPELQTSGNTSFDRGPAPKRDPAKPDKEWWDTLDVVKQSMRGAATGALEVAKFPTEIAAAVGIPGGETAEAFMADQIELQTKTWGEAQSTAGGFAKPIAQFGAGALLTGGAGRALGLTKMIAGASGLTQAALAGTATGALAFDPHDGRLSNILQDHHIGGAITDWLASNEDDSALEGRLKSLVENGVIGGALHLGGNLVKAVAKSERLRYFLSDKFVPNPPNQEIQQVVEDIAAARAARKDISEKIGSHPADAAGAAGEAASPELTQLKQAKAEMKAIRDDRLAKFESLKGTYEYKKLHSSVRERLEAAAEGRIPRLAPIPAAALSDELGRKAVGGIARSIKKGLDEIADRELLGGEIARHEETQAFLAKNINITKMDFSDAADQAAFGEALRATAADFQRVSPKIVEGAFDAHVGSELAILMGNDPAEALRRLGGLGGYVKEAGALLLAGKQISKNFAKQYTELAVEAAKYGDNVPPELMIRKVQAMRNMQAFLSGTKGTQREMARAIRAQRASVGDMVENIDADVLQRAMSEQFLSNAHSIKLDKQIAAFANGDDKAVLKALMRRNHPYASAIREYYTNSLLSGPITFTINGVGNTMKMLWDPVDKGAARFWELYGQGATVASAAHNVGGEMKAVYGAFLETSVLFVRTMAGALNLPPSAMRAEVSQSRSLLNPSTLAGNVKEAWRSSKSQLAPGGYSAEAQSRVGAITGDLLVGDKTQALIGDQATAWLKHATDWTGKAVRFPTRVMSTVDEASTGMNFFMHARRESYRMGTEKGLTGDRLEEFMRTFVEKTDDKTLDGVFQRSLESAKRNVWQNELGSVGKKTAALLEEHPLTGLVVPFFKTPVNILKYTASHHPLGLAIQSAMGKDHFAYNFLMGTGEGRRALLATKEGADFAGRWTTASMLTAASAATIDGSWITGRAPSDQKAREAWESTGRTEYSIKFPGTDTWLSYGRLDPFGMLLGAQADFFLYGPSALGGGRASDDDAQAHDLGFLAMTYSTANMIASRNYLQGVVQMYDALTGLKAGDPAPLGRFVTQTAGGFIPNAISQLNGRVDFGLLDSSPVMRDANEYNADGSLDLLRTFANSLATRAGSDMAPRKWTAFGPSVRKSGVGWDLISPIAGSRMRNSKFADVLAAEGVSPVFADQQRKFMDYPIPFGHRDRMGELMATVKIGGVTFAEKGEQLVADPRFAALPTAETGDRFNSKSDVLHKMVLQYQKAAFAKLVEEFPDVRKGFDAFRVGQRVPDAAPAAAIKAITGIKQ